MVWRLPTVGRIREHVVDDEEPTRHHVPGPPVVVGAGRRLGVATVDEDKGHRRGPERGHGDRGADHGHHALLHPGLVEGTAQHRQCVDAAHGWVDEPGVVVLPPRLVLLRAAVVVNGHHDAAVLARRRRQIERGLPAVRADLDQRTERSRPAGRLIQSEPFIGRHEAGGRLGRRAQRWIHAPMLSSPGQGSFAARTSTGLMDGGSLNSSPARAINAAAIFPWRWACRPSEDGNASKMPYVSSSILMANHAVVSFSSSASGSALRRKSATSFSRPGFTLNVARIPTVTMVDLLDYRSTLHLHRTIAADQRTVTVIRQPCCA